MADIAKCRVHLEEQLCVDIDVTPDEFEEEIKAYEESLVVLQRDETGVRSVWLLRIPVSQVIKKTHQSGAAVGLDYTVTRSTYIDLDRIIFWESLN